MSAPIRYQVYSDIQQMGPTVQEGLAQLLCREVPNLQWLHQKDRFAHQQTCYYLFFEENNEHPIGMLRPVTRKVATSGKKSFWRKLFHPPSGQKWLNIQSPGASGHGFIFAPHWEERGVAQGLEILGQLVRRGYDLIQFSVPRHLSFDFPFRANSTQWRQYNLLSKRGEGHRDYLATLPPPLAEKIQLEDNFFRSQSQYQLVESPSFSGLFGQNEYRAQLGQMIKNHLFLNCYQKISAQFLALYCQDRLLTIAVYLTGREGQAFADMICNLDLEMNSSFHHLVFQELIQLFYRDKKARELRFFNTLNCPRDLQRELPNLQLQASYGKTYIIPSTGKKKRRSPVATPSHGHRTGL